MNVRSFEKKKSYPNSHTHKQMNTRLGKKKKKNPTSVACLLEKIIMARQNSANLFYCKAKISSAFYLVKILQKNAFFTFSYLATLAPPATTTTTWKRIPSIHPPSLKKLSAPFAWSEKEEEEEEGHITVNPPPFPFPLRAKLTHPSSSLAITENQFFWGGGEGCWFLLLLIHFFHKKYFWRIWRLKKRRRSRRHQSQTGWWCLLTPPPSKFFWHPLFCFVLFFGRITVSASPYTYIYI